MADEPDPLVMMYLRRIDAQLDLLSDDLAVMRACVDRIVVRLERMSHDLLPSLTR